MTLAWHFVGQTLRDGRPVPADGEWLVHDGPLVLCESGLHASVCPFDALSYAPGPILCRVEMGGTIRHGDDKLVAMRRRIVARVDATPILREFARACARDVLHLWDAPDVVRRYLETGDETIRDAASAAASADAWAWRDAASADAWAAARDAASAAAWALRDAASADAWGAARAAHRQRWGGMVATAFREALS